MHVPNLAFLEFICVKISLSSHALFVVLCYIPPSSSFEVYQLLIDAIIFINDMLGPADNLVVFGDFNLPHLTWTLSEDTTHLCSSNASSRVEVEVIDNFKACCLEQISPVLNSLSRQLDLVFSSDSVNCSVGPSSLVLCNIDVYHPPLLTSYSFHPSQVPKLLGKSFNFNFRKANFELLDRLLSELNFPTILSSNNINQNVSSFYSALFDCIALTVPFTVRNNPSGPIWFNQELRSLRNAKNKAWTTFLHSDASSDYAEFVALYDEFHALSSLQYESYLSSTQSEIFADPRMFWNFVNSKRKSDSFPSSLNYLSSSSNDPNLIANFFSSFFSKSFNSDSFAPSQSYFQYLSNAPKVGNDVFSCDNISVSEYILQLKDDYSSGPDGIPAIVLKRCYRTLSEPLAFLFQSSLDLGVFPEAWKTSFLIPTFKKGDRRDVTNYRPIAKLSCIPKLFERLVYKKLSFICQSVISDAQHGFVQKKSTVTNLVEHISRIKLSMEDGFQTDCVATDFSKAFDKLSHKLIIFKLNMLGFSNLTVDWVKSYLTNRSYQVSFRSELSSSFLASSGVPQGSHLGPLLFILCINDVALILKSANISIYADDMKISKVISVTSDCYALQEDLVRFGTWCSQNNLELNIGKCQVITFSRKRQDISFDYCFNGNVISRVLLFTDLGVVCDRELNFRGHYDKIIQSANSTMGFVFRWSKEFNNIFITRLLFTSFVRPILEYASQVWSPYQSIHISRIESVQRRFVKFALRGFNWSDRYHLPPYLERLSLLNMNSLAMRRKVARISFVHQTLAGNINSPFILSRLKLNVNARSLRNVELLHLSTCRTDYSKYEPINRMIRDVNEFPGFDSSLSKHVLKSLIYSSFPPHAS